MLKHLYIASLALAAQIGGALANGVYFKGEVYILSASAECDYNLTGTRFIARYQPAGLGTNGSFASMAWFVPDASFSTFGFVSNSGAFGTTQQAVSTYAIYAGGVGGSPYATTLAFNAQAPATLTDTTKYVYIRGTFINWPPNSKAGCNISFQMPLSPN